MKNDVSSREDIKLIIHKFYEKLLSDEDMFSFFKEIQEGGNLEEHLEIIVDFWEDILFQSYKYKNNPMQKHLSFAKKNPFTQKHFTIWLAYFQNTIDEYFKGENASVMKNRAQSIATVMQLKMNIF